MDSIALDTLLVTLQQDAANETARNIIATVRDELELLSENLSWAHILISFYAEEHEKKLSPYMYSGNQKDLTEKFVRNDSFRRHLEAQHPWLGIPRNEEQRASDIANFNTAMQVERLKQEELIKRWPATYGKTEGAKDPVVERAVENLLSDAAEATESKYDWNEAPVESPPIVPATTENVDAGMPDGGG